MYDNDKKMIMIIIIMIIMLVSNICFSSGMKSLFLCSLINLTLDVYVLNLLLFRFLMNVGFLETLGN